MLSDQDSTGFTWSPAQKGPDTSPLRNQGSKVISTRTLGANSIVMRYPDPL